MKGNNLCREQAFKKGMEGAQYANSTSSGAALEEPTYARGIDIKLLIVVACLSSQVEPRIQKVQGQSCGKMQPVSDILPGHRSDGIHCLQVLLDLLVNTASLRKDISDLCPSMNLAPPVSLCRAEGERREERDREQVCRPFSRHIAQLKIFKRGKCAKGRTLFTSMLPVACRDKSLKDRGIL